MAYLSKKELRKEVDTIVKKHGVDILSVCEKGKEIKLTVYQSSDIDSMKAEMLKNKKLYNYSVFMFNSNLEREDFFIIFNQENLNLCFY